MKKIEELGYVETDDKQYIGMKKLYTRNLFTNDEIVFYDNETVRIINNRDRISTDELLAIVDECKDLGWIGDE